MQINFTGQGMEITPPLRLLVEDKFQRIIRHFDKNLMNINVVLKTEQKRKTTYVAEANIHIKGNDVYAKAEEDDMYKSIDQMIIKLDKQLRKIKDKLTEHH
jgi:putative sigma-54 modulation protein